MEVLNMAGLWQLPVIYVCENNGFGEYTRTEEATVTSQPIGARAAAYGLPTSQVDGNDVIAVYEAVRAAVDAPGPAAAPGSSRRAPTGWAATTWATWASPAATAPKRSWMPARNGAGRALPGVAAGE